MTTIAASPIVDAILAHLRTSLPASCPVYDAQGPRNPADSCPYVVVYGDAGMPEGAPLSVNRSLTMSVTVRAVGTSAAQSRWGGDALRAALHGFTATVGVLRVTSWEDGYPTPILRDDSIAPDVVFEHLLMFSVRADP